MKAWGAVGRGARETWGGWYWMGGMVDREVAWDWIGGGIYGTGVDAAGVERADRFGRWLDFAGEADQVHCFESVIGGAVYCFGSKMIPRRIRLLLFFVCFFIKERRGEYAFWGMRCEVRTTARYVWFCGCVV